MQIDDAVGAEAQDAPERPRDGDYVSYLLPIISRNFISLNAISNVLRCV